MTTIKVLVSDQNLTITESPVVASGGINETEVLFEFCANWSGFTKIAVFADAKKDNWYSATIDNDNKAIVPAQVTATKGRFWLGVVGVKDDIRYTTQLVQYDVAEGPILSLTDDELPPSQLFVATQADIARLEERIAALEGNSGGSSIGVNLRGKTVKFTCKVPYPNMSDDATFTVFAIDNENYIELDPQYGYYFGYGIFDFIYDTGYFEDYVFTFDADSDHIVTTDTGHVGFTILN